MANEIKVKQGTDITWLNTGGTQTLTLTSVATNAGRKGTVNDFGATFARRVRLALKTAFATGPTAGNLVHIYWCSSHDNTNFDGNLSSGDAAMSDTDVLNQLIYVGSLVADNVTTVQWQSFVFDLPARYGFPVIFNASGQSLHGTAGNHGVTVTPLIDELQ